MDSWRSNIRSQHCSQRPIASISENGNWGPNFRRVINFPVSTYSRDLHITLAEYFWDNDPGQGSGTPLIAFDGAYDQSLDHAISGSILPLNGVHTLNIRAKDINDAIKSTESYIASIKNEIKRSKGYQKDIKHNDKVQLKINDQKSSDMY